jgi:hypothetical protein
MMNVTYTAATRTEFANALRACRAMGALRAYGRLGQLGRSLIATNGVRIVFPAWTSKPPMNLHR